MQPSRQSIETLIEHIRNGTCTSEELALFRKWVTALDMGDAASDLSPDLVQLFKDRMHQQLMQEIQPAKAVAFNGKTFFRRYVAAAAIVVAFSCGLLLWFLNSRRTGVPAEALSSRAVINNKQHVVRKVTMPDGTVIWLNRNSSLEFDQVQYNRTQRSVKLSGEGFFEVAKDSSRPFLVETGNIHIRVLGTAFNVEAWQQESEIRVSLVHGSVSLKNISNAATTVLIPDQTMRYSKQTGEWMVLPMAVNHIEAWTTGAMVFNEVPLEEALQRIADRFHLTMDFDKSILLNKRITASFPSRDWQSALHNILFVHGLNFHIVKGHVVIAH
jgi:ferric-dicitrate binding protein FerR (iron transport regulator)